jgi:hypothetical protein
MVTVPRSRTCVHKRPNARQPGSRLRVPRSARGVESTIAYVDAYECANGHTSKECPLCGSYETAAWRDSNGPPHYHAICSACGNDSVTQS